MKVGIAYAQPKRQVLLSVEVPEGSTIQDAIDQSGVLNQCPEIDLTKQKVGVFGKVAALDAKLEDGDRVEIYRPLTVDPKTVKSRAKTAAGADPATSP